MRPASHRARLASTFSAAALLVGMTLLPANAAAEDLLWVRSIGSAAADEITGVACDRDDNVYTAGRFSGTVDFDPEAGVTNLTAIGPSDAYVTRLDRDGRLVWAVQFGGTTSTGSAPMGSVASDGAGFLYVTGGFNGTVDFDPSAGVFEMTALGANGDMYVVKLTTAGQFVWARQIGCPSGGDAGPNAIAANGTRVAFTGNMSGTCDFDPGPGVAEVTVSAGTLENFFVAALDAGGGFAFASPFESPGSDNPHGIAVDAAGNVYTTGRARGPIDYDPGPGFDIQTGDMFVIKQSPDGTEQWARAFASGSLGRGFGVRTDASGGVYVAGQFSNSGDFDPGPGTAVRTAVALTDGFLLKLDASGNYAWVATFGGTGNDAARQVAVGTDGRVHVVGSFAGTADFDPGAAAFNLTSAGSTEGFALTLDQAGQFLRALSIGGTQADSILNTAIDRGGHLVAIGSFTGTADFDPGPNVSNLTAVGSSDAFVWKYGTSELRLEQGGAAGTSIAFTPGSPALYDLVRGRMIALRLTRTYAQATCFGSLLSAPATDTEIPQVGDAFYYLARGRNCCAAEGYGDSTLQPDPRDDLDLASPCP
ncbi:MAG TPA: SBBP repeat-containing protein [Candidatus Polarisedimenticolia bacterium]|nr:SBBP repeat-containing protein [Candidatus Polarisedimenticolia bacterium]